MPSSDSRLEPVSFGAFVLLVPRVNPAPRDERVVRPARRGTRRHA
jgi:hypothetical protein